MIRHPLRTALLLALTAQPGIALSQATMKSATWWNPDEAGWGLFTIDQGNVIAPGWFTYDSDGEPVWFLVPGASLRADGSYGGDVMRYTGVPLAQIAGSAADPAVKVGEASLRFVDEKSLQFDYTVNGQSQSKSLTRFAFGDKDLACAATTGSRAGASNYSDLWFSAESSGWGVHVSHLDDDLYATWYTYDTDREAIFLVGATTRQADGSFTGALRRQRNGTPFAQISGAPPSAGADEIGTLTLRFNDGEHMSMSYTIGDVTQSRSLTRFQFGSTASVCSVVPYSTSNSGGTPGSGQDECQPPLAVGDRYRVRSTVAGSIAGETDAEVIGTGTFDGHPVFRVRYRPVGQSTEADVIEFIEQTASERIHYGSEGYIPEIDAVGTTRFDPPVRTPRSTPVGSNGRLVYKARVNYTALGQAVNAVIDFDQTWKRIGTETQSSPAGTFTDACKFDTTLKSTFDNTIAGVTTRVVVDAIATQWSHRDIGAFRTLSESSTSVSVQGSPFPIPPTVTTGSDLSEIVSASIGGRSFP